MAAHYVNEIRSVQPRGPYYLGGRSSGGVVAFEMALQLRRQGDEVALVALFDTFSPRSNGYRSPGSSIGKTWLLFHLNNLRGLGPSEEFSYLIERGRNLVRGTKRRLWKRGWKMVQGLYQHFGATIPKPVLAVERALINALRNYEPQVYPGRLVLFRAADRPGDAIEYDLGWETLTTWDVETLEVPGDHSSMYLEPQVQVLAQKLRSKLSNSQLVDVVPRT